LKEEGEYEKEGGNHSTPLLNILLLLFLPGCVTHYSSPSYLPQKEEISPAAAAAASFDIQFYFFTSSLFSA
jgi:hypothetical protein